jgi:O-antigen ligase
MLDYLYALILPLCGLLIFAIIITWHKISLEWLNKLSNLIIWLLPFDYLPSIPVGPTKLKINYIVIALATYILINLSIKGKIKPKIDNIESLISLVAFSALLTIPNIISPVKFGISYTGFILCILASYLITHYATNIKTQIKRLIVILGFTSIFGVYQFLGDMVGVSTRFTFLREMYTKAVFGIPRIQGTANEPQLYAGMLLLPIIFLILKHFTRNNIDTNLGKYGWTLYIIPLVFIATISKGAFLALGITMCCYFLFRLAVQPKYVRILAIIITIPALLATLSIVISQPKIYNKLSPVIENIIGTIDGNTASSVERTAFIEDANNILINHPIIGIGPGQYGSYVGSNSVNLIVNNVYLEVWLEYGIIALILFVIYLSWVVIKIYRVPSFYNTLLLLTLVTYLIQWIFFSPLYILPIFIIIGLCLASVRVET